MLVGHHRRFTANHTWHVNGPRQKLFVKLTPSPAEAAEERAGHDRLRRYYPVPHLVWHHSLGLWSVLVYQRHGDATPDSGLLLDAINTADRDGNTRDLDACLSGILQRYVSAIRATLCRISQSRTVSKLYADRIGPGRRLDAYYGKNRPLLHADGAPLRPGDLAHTTLVVNGWPHHIDFAALMAWLRACFAPDRPVWAAVTQGDPTDLNIADTPLWFDYDTGGLNALAGEFACFLWYQHLHGGWLVPTYNPAAFIDHPATLNHRESNRPHVQITHGRRGDIVIDYRHRASLARRHTIATYLQDLVYPLASGLGVTDPLDWMRPYLVLRILGVYNLSDLTCADAALSLAYLAAILDPTARLEDLFTLPASTNTSAVAGHDGRHDC